MLSEEREERVKKGRAHRERESERDARGRGGRAGRGATPRFETSAHAAPSISNCAGLRNSVVKREREGGKGREGGGKRFFVGVVAGGCVGVNSACGEAAVVAGQPTPELEEGAA